MATRVGISKAMLSKIENAQTSCSLATLSRLSMGLDVPVSTLFRGAGTQRESVYTPAGHGAHIVGRGTRAGHHYEMLGALRGRHRRLEAVLVTLEQESTISPRFAHPGTELLFMLEGDMVYTTIARTTDSAWRLATTRRRRPARTEKPHRTPHPISRSHCVPGQPRRVRPSSETRKTSRTTGTGCIRMGLAVARRLPNTRREHILRSRGRRGTVREGESRVRTVSCARAMPRIRDRCRRTARNLGRTVRPRTQPATMAQATPLHDHRSTS